MNTEERTIPTPENTPPSPASAAPNIAAFRQSVVVSWRRWLEHRGGQLGFALLMCGLACFLAGNWSGMSNAARLGVMQCGLAGFVLAGMVTRRKKKGFAALSLLGAGLMVGAFWIVFSQIYQTGADSWQLFALWAAGVLPWLLLSPSVSLWLLLLILANTSMTLWSVQNGPSPWRTLGPAVLYCLLMNSALWLICVGVEWRAWRRRNGPLLRAARRWSLTVLPFLLGWATLEGCFWLLQAALNDSWPRVSLATILAVAVLVVVGLYERTTRRVGPFTLLALCGFPLINCALTLLVEDGDAGLILFLYSSANIGYTALVLHTLAALRHLVHDDDPSDMPSEMQGHMPSEDAPTVTASPAGLPEVLAVADVVPTATPEDRGEEVPPPDIHQEWKSRQKDRSRQLTQQVGQGITHVLSALGGMLSSAFLIAFASYTFGDTGSPVSFSIVMAVIFFGAGLACARAPHSQEKSSTFFRTLALCLSLCGWFFLTLAAWLYWESPIAGLVLLPVVAGLYMVQPQPVWRFLSVGSALTFAMMTLLWTHARSETYSLIALILLAACALPLYVLAAWGKWRPEWLTPAREHAVLPCLYASIGVLVIFLPTWSWLYLVLRSMEHWLQQWPLVLLVIPVAGLVVLLVSQCLGYFRLALKTHKSAVFAAVGSLAATVVGLAVLYFLVHHVARSFLLVLILPLLGHACRLRLLERVGLLLFGFFLFLHYYSWHVSFLDKAYNMSVVGFILLAMAMVLAVWRRRKRRRIMQAVSPFLSLPSRSLVGWCGAALVALGLTVASFQYAIHDRERVLAEGDTLMLALAPVDPLSLVQGYYMELAYEAERALRMTQKAYGEGLESTEPEGYAILQRVPDDPLPVGEIKGFRSEIGSLAPGEFAIPYRLDAFGFPSLSLPAGFLMEESKASVYEQARYGVFRCVPGVCVLSGLADSMGQPLGQPVSQPLNPPVSQSLDKPLP